MRKIRPKRSRHAPTASPPARRTDCEWHSFPSLSLRVRGTKARPPERMNPEASTTPAPTQPAFGQSAIDNRGQWPRLGSSPRSCTALPPRFRRRRSGVILHSQSTSRLPSLGTEDDALLHQWNWHSLLRSPEPDRSAGRLWGMSCLGATGVL